jgi:hypothetical protein
MENPAIHKRRTAKESKYAWVCDSLKKALSRLGGGEASMLYSDQIRFGTSSWVDFSLIFSQMSVIVRRQGDPRNSQSKPRRSSLFPQVYWLKY